MKPPSLSKKVDFYVSSKLSTIDFDEEVYESDVLTSDLLPEAKAIKVVDSTLWPQSGIVKIGNEYIHYNNNSNNTLLVSKRGSHNTIPSAHSINDTVSLIAKTFYGYGIYKNISRKFRPDSVESEDRYIAFFSDEILFEITNKCTIVTENEEKYWSVFDPGKVAPYGEAIFHDVHVKPVGPEWLS